MLPLNLDGCNLGKRHQQLNEKVAEALSSNLNFDEIKTLPEETDVDRLFKIKLALKCKNVNYIMETLKSGDELYISSALKCPWLFDDQYADIINCDYLHDDVFPFMSQKMIKKTLTAISINLKNEMRNLSFYSYCVANGMSNIAKKFLLHIPASVKMSVTKKNDSAFKSHDKSIQFFINSFELAEIYLKNLKYTNDKLYELRYLYSVSDVLYLDLLEKYGQITSWNSRIFGLRKSRDIMLKHKNRIFINPSLYLNKLNMKIILKYLSVDDVKLILRLLLPDEVEHFWNRNFYSDNKKLLGLLPLLEKFSYLKTIYQQKYPGVEFEMQSDFYTQGLYELMTDVEKEQWALRQLESSDEHFSSEKYYKWYRFVKFAKSFEDIKGLIKKTVSNTARLGMLDTLVVAAKTPNEIEILLTYFCERHINEQDKEHFIHKVIENQNVFEFDESCWNVFNEILHSFDVYNEEIKLMNRARFTSFIYHVLHGKRCEILEELLFENEVPYHYINEALENIPDSQHKVLFEQLSNIIIHKLNQYTGENYNEKKVMFLIKFYKNLKKNIEKSDDPELIDYPEVIVNFAKMNSNIHSHIYPAPNPKANFVKTFYEDQLSVPGKKKSKTFKHCYWIPISIENNLIRLLKTDTVLLNEQIQNTVIIKQPSREFKLTRLLKKIKIYFSNDSRKLWLNSFMYNLNDKHFQIVNMAIFSIFQLADQSQKEELMLKYAPMNAKIRFSKTNKQSKNVQKAICRFSMYSRPPIPLHLTMLYMKGDYGRYCLPMFDCYVANLPYSKLTDFIDCTMDAALSIQKHSIRLVFKNSDCIKLKNFIEKTWCNIKNVSLRNLIFSLLCDNINRECNKFMQKGKFDILKSIIPKLKEDDDYKIFEKLCEQTFPKNLRGELFEYVYVMLHQLPNKSHLWEYKIKILSRINYEIDHVSEDFVHKIMEFIDDSHDFTKEFPISSDYDWDQYTCDITCRKPYLEKRYYKEKWKLLTKYLAIGRTTIPFEKKLVLIKRVIHNFVIMWNNVKEGYYVVRQYFNKFFCFFIDNAVQNIFLDSCTKLSSLLEAFLQEIFLNFSINSTIHIVLKLKLTILLENFVNTVKDTRKCNSEKFDYKEMAKLFGTELSLLLSTLLEQKLYYPSIASKFVCMLNDVIRKICRHMCTVRTDVFTTLTASALLNFEVLPFYMLVIYILPLKKPQECDEEYISITEKLKSSNNLEVKYNYYERFCTVIVK